MGDILHRQCSWCRRVYRDGQWVEATLDEPSSSITHGLCPECADRYYPEPETAGTPVPARAPTFKA